MCLPAFEEKETGKIEKPSDYDGEATLTVPDDINIWVLSTMDSEGNTKYHTFPGDTSAQEIYEKAYDAQRSHYFKLNTITGDKTHEQRRTWFESENGKPEDGKQEPKDEQVWFEHDGWYTFSGVTVHTPPDQDVKYELIARSYCPKHHEQQLMLEADDCEYPSPEEQAYQDKITKETLEKVNRDLQEKEHKRDITKNLFVMADPHANQLGLNQFMGGHIESN